MLDPTIEPMTTVGLKPTDPALAGQVESRAAIADRLGWTVRLMGELAIRYPGLSWRNAQIGSRRARILLALLAVDGGRVIAMDQIVEVLWSRAAPKRPEANVATLVSRLRATFDTQVICGGQHGYRLGDSVETDLAVAVNLVTTAAAHSAQADYASVRAVADRALALMHDRVLPEFADEPWVMPALHLRQRLLRRARHLSSEAALCTGQPAAALAVAEEAMAADPMDEAACRLVMRAFEAMAQPALAVRAYGRLREMLAMDLGVDPAESTRHLYLTILRGESPRAVRSASVSTSA